MGPDNERRPGRGTPKGRPDTLQAPQPSATNAGNGSAGLGGCLATTADFLQLLFADLPGLIEVRLIEDRKTTEKPKIIDRDWYEKPENLISGLARLQKTSEEYRTAVFFGVLPRKKRGDGKAKDTLPGRVGWVDLDFKHFKGGEKEAREPLSTFPLQPSIIVRSGHGLHLYWIIREATPPEELGALSKRLAHALGGDCTHDPAHLLRLPGTMNRKAEWDAVPGDPTEVTIEKLEGDVAYNACEIEDALDMVGASPKGPTKSERRQETPALGRVGSYDLVHPESLVPEGSITIDPAADIPRDRLDGYFEIDNKFKATWERNRPDLQDESSSGYAMALASNAAKLQWDVQGIVDLLIAYRREKWDQEPEPESFYRHTVGKAIARWPFTLIRSVITSAHATGDASQIYALAPLFARLTYDDAEQLLDEAKNALGNAITKKRMRPLIKQVREEQGLLEHAGGSGKKPSQADLLVGLVLDSDDVELFHTPGRHDADAYATTTIQRRRETWAVSSRGFRFWLTGEFYRQHQKAPGSQAVQDALNAIIGCAIHDADEHEVFVRLAENGASIILDLGNDDWNAVEVTGMGWRIVSSEDVPVRFVRKRGMLALPTPVKGGSLADLRALVNVPDDDSWVLLCGVLVAYLRPRGPYPVLIVNGEQGSAKSTLCKRVRALIDPNKAPLRRPPKEERDLMIAATNSWVCGFDNLSGISPSLSDSICMLATGGGFGTRLLYSDDDEKLFDAMRPVVVNGIEELSMRPDLLDRAVQLTLPPIREDARVDEEVLLATFEKQRPKILGALLDGDSAALRNRHRVKMPRKPRMADFAIWATAAEESLGLEPGQFLEAYQRNREMAQVATIETSPVGPSVIVLMNSRDAWAGTAQELLNTLQGCADEKTHTRKDWPRNPRAMRAALDQIAPNLRAMGVDVQVGTRRGGQRIIVLEKTEKGQSRPATSTKTSEPVSGERSVDGNSGRAAVGHPKEASQDGRDGPAPVSSSKPGEVAEEAV